MADIGAIPSSISVVIDPAVTAPAVGNTFRIQPTDSTADLSVTFQATGTLTGLSSDLQISLDGGTTWVNYQGAASGTPIGTAFLTAAAPQRTLTPIIGNAMLRFNHTASTGNAVIRCMAN